MKDIRTRVSYIKDILGHPIFMLHVGREGQETKPYYSISNNRWETECQYAGGPPNITKWCGPAFDPFNVDEGKTYMGWSI